MRYYQQNYALCYFDLSVVVIVQCCIKCRQFLFEILFFFSKLTKNVLVGRVILPQDVLNAVPADGQKQARNTQQKFKFNCKNLFLKDEFRNFSSLYKFTTGIKNLRFYIYYLADILSSNSSQSLSLLLAFSGTNYTKDETRTSTTLWQNEDKQGKEKERYSTLTHAHAIHGSRRLLFVSWSQVRGVIIWGDLYFRQAKISSNFMVIFQFVHGEEYKHDK